MKIYEIIGNILNIFYGVDFMILSYATYNQARLGNISYDTVFIVVPICLIGVYITCIQPYYQTKGVNSK